MVRRFTPFIGLAVVMALALAAVFGSMSLANPAAAQTPPDDTLMVYSGLSVEYDVEDIFVGAERTATGVAYTAAVEPAGVVTATVGTGDDANEVTIARADALPAGASVLNATVTVTNPSKPAMKTT